MALKRALDEAEADKIEYAPPVSMTGPAVASLAAAAPPDVRAAAVEADRAELRAIEARATAAAARGEGAALRKAAQRQYEQATGKVRATDGRAAAQHEEWVAAYRAARAAGVDPALLAYGVSRRNETRPGVRAPD